MHPLPNYPKFKQLSLEDLPQIKERLQAFAPTVCELSLANLFIYQGSDKTQFTLINGNLCFLVSPPNEAPFFLEPIGQERLLDTVDVCLAHTKKLARVSEKPVHLLPLKKYKISCTRSHFDYLYLTQELAELKGKRFDGKRNHLKNFARRYPDYQFKPLQKEQKQAYLNVFEKWSATKQETLLFTKLSYTSQKEALELAFDLFDKLSISGGAIAISGEIQGFVVGSPLNTQTANLHFSYHNPQLRGLSQALLWEACRKIFASYKYVNLEQDLGLPGLRKSKLSYYPVRLEKKFEVH